jgi:hypothetical protein
MLKLKNISDKRANIQSRAHAILAIATKFPALEAAMRSRNNRDFRLAVVEIVRAAKDDDSASALADVISIENLSAYNQFCAEVFEGLDSAKPQAASKVDIEKLF